MAPGTRQVHRSRSCSPRKMYHEPPTQTKIAPNSSNVFDSNSLFELLRLEKNSSWGWIRHLLSGVHRAVLEPAVQHPAPEPALKSLIGFYYFYLFIFFPTMNHVCKAPPSLTLVSRAGRVCGLGVHTHNETPPSGCESPINPVGTSSLLLQVETLPKAIRSLINAKLWHYYFPFQPCQLSTAHQSLQAFQKRFGVIWVRPA